MGAADLQAHLLQDAGHTVADGGGGSQAEVHNAEGGIQAAGGILGHQLPHAGDAEGGLLDGLSHHVEGLSLHALEGMVHHAGAGNAHVDDPLGLTHAVEGAGHEGVVLHGVAEHHQLGAAEAALVGSALGQVLDGAAHEGHSVHVDARLGGAHIDAGAHQIGGGQGLGDGGDEVAVGLGHALLHQSREAANEIDSGGLGRFVQGHSEGGVVVGIRRGSYQGDGSDGDALIDDGDAELLLDGLAGDHQILGITGDLIVDSVAGGLGVAAGAGEQGNSHGDGAHIQMLLIDHLDRLHNFILIEHGCPPKRWDMSDITLRIEHTAGSTTPPTSGRPGSAYSGSWALPIRSGVCLPCVPILRA